MPFRHFRALLDAGLRWRMREQRMAMVAAAFPHMEESAQKEAVRQIADGAQGHEEAEVVDDNTDTLAALRAQARLTALLEGKGRGD